MSVTNRRIEKSAEATLSLGDMQFIKIKSMISQDVEGNEEEIAKADAKLWSEVAVDLRRGMWSTIKGLGKTTDADKKFFETCAQRVQEATTPKKTEGDKA